MFSKLKDVVNRGIHSFTVCIYYALFVNVLFHGETFQILLNVKSATTQAVLTLLQNANIMSFNSAFSLL